jgi:hypothetical protein
MAERILHNSPPKESPKTALNSNLEICQNECRNQLPEIIESTHVPTEIPPIIRETTVGYLPRPADYCVGILLETIFNLSRLHEDLTKIQESLVKGGER